MLRTTAALLCGTLLVACGKKDSAVQSDPAPGADKTGPASAGPFSTALSEVIAQCPEDYPEVITPLPDANDFENIGTDDLMSMLESWNPSLRDQAAKALSERGQEVMELLKKGSHSDNWMVRAGSTSALAAIIKGQLQSAAKEEQESIKQKHADVVSEFIRLTEDERLEVRVSALSGLGTVAPQTPEAVKAVLKLCNDPDDYLSQDAMITLDKNFTIELVESAEIISAMKAAFDGPLPRGKGHIVRIISHMPPDTQHQFIPELLAHLDWRPIRDTMFAAGGQAEAIGILTSLKETQLVERLPKLMGKTGRGYHLFLPCVESAKLFGADAKPILPQLKEICADNKANGKEAKIRPTRDEEVSLMKLKETIDYLETL